MPQRFHFVSPCCFSCLLMAMLVLLGNNCFAQSISLPKADFVSPPDGAKPWVYWFWLNGNVTKEGITADLEAIKQVALEGC